MVKIKNIIKNKELRNKIILTFTILLIYKIGTTIKLPTVNNSVDAVSNSVLNLMNYVSGSFLEKFTMFSLGITPYITASIAVQLLGMGVIPALERWKKEGEKGTKKTEKLTFIVSVILALIESILLTLVFKGQYEALKDDSIITFILTASLLFMGSLITLLMARIITKKGIGNGASLIIFTGIISRLGYDIYWTGYNMITNNPITILYYVLYLLFFVLLIAGIVFIEKSVRKIKIEYSKQSATFMSSQSNIPLKVNLGGVIPIIFTVSILTGFAYLGYFLNNDILKNMANYNDILGYLIYISLIMLFSIYYGKELYNAKTISDNLNKSNAVIQGKLPGKETEKYLDKTITHMTIIGGICLIVIASIPVLISSFTNTTYNLTLGGTSIMIMAGVATETMSEIKAKIKTVKTKKQSLFD